TQPWTGNHSSVASVRRAVRLQSPAKPPSLSTNPAFRVYYIPAGSHSLLAEKLWKDLFLWFWEERGEHRGVRRAGRSSKEVQSPTGCTTRTPAVACKYELVHPAVIPTRPWHSNSQKHTHIYTRTHRERDKRALLFESL